MKRYRALPGLWDGRPVYLKSILETSQPLDELNEKNKIRIIAQLQHSYGQLNFQEKLARYVESGYLNMSIVNDHNSVLLSIRDSYIMGNFFPSLTASCALGEWILNDLVLSMRNHFKATDAKIHKKDAFTNWGLMIVALLEWNLIAPSHAKDFKELLHLRKASIHYDPKSKTALAQQSNRALQLIAKLIHSIFSAVISEKYRISDSDGASFIKKEMENHPFIRRYYIPNCIYVGPDHQLTNLLVYPPAFEDQSMGGAVHRRRVCK